MSYSRRPSLMGALLWIALGLTFLLYNFKMGPDLEWLYRQYWPFLLILLGLGKVVDYFFPKTSLGLRFGELFVLVIAFALGYMGTRVWGGGEQNFTEFFRAMPARIQGIFNQPNFTYSEESVYPLKSVSLLRVENSYGMVSVLPGSDGEIRIRFKKVIAGNSEAQAKKMAEDIRLETESSNSNAAFVIRTNRYALNSRNWRFRTDIEVLAPKNINVQVKNYYGEIQLAHITGNFDLTTSYLPIDIQDCHGKLILSYRYSKCALSNFVGDVSITNEYSNSEFINIDGNLSVKSIQGSLKVEQATKPVTIDGKGTSIQVRDLQDSLKINTDHQEVNISDVAGNVTLDTRYVSLLLNNIKGSVRINSNTDNVNAEDIAGGLSIMAHGSGIRVNRIQGPLDVRTSLREVIVDDFAGSCLVNNEYGNIKVTAPTLGKGDITLKNRTGGIDLYLPEDAAFDLDAVAQNGRVWSDQDVLQSYHNPGSGSLKYKLKDGGPKIVLETENSNIRILSSIKHNSPEPRRRTRRTPDSNRFAAVAQAVAGILPHNR